MVPRVRVAESAIAGVGVFAEAEFRAGEVVLVVDDSHVVDGEHPVPEGEENHCDFLDGGRVVWMQAPERHINHSCEPNVFVHTRAGVREVVALRPIGAGEEVVYDYSINGFGDTTWRCECGAGRCRGLVHSDFFQLPPERQREYLPLLEGWFREERAAEVKALEAAIAGG